MINYLLIRNILPFKKKSNSTELTDLLIGKDGLLEQIGSKIVAEGSKLNQKQCRTEQFP